MKFGIVIFLKFIQRFGLWSGVKLFLQFSKGRVASVKVPGLNYPLSFRPFTSDIPLFYQVFVLNEYDLKMAEAPGVVVDGGANIGLFTVKMKSCFPEAKVICVEPDPDNFRLAQKNLAPYTDVHFENSGLWNRDIRLKVYDKYDCGKWGMVVEEDEADGTIDAISMNRLLKKYSLDRIDILKLDIESSEKILFSEGYEDWLPKVKMIIIELHDWIIPGCSKAFFTAINKVYADYSFSCQGENIIITNKSASAAV